MADPGRRHGRRDQRQRSGLWGALTAIVASALVVLCVLIVQGARSDDGDAAGSLTDAASASTAAATTLGAPPLAGTSGTTLVPTAVPRVTDAGATTPQPAGTSAESVASAPTAPTTPSPTAGPTVSGAAGTTQLPEVDATAYAVLDTATGEWLAESGADQQHPVGSTMKLLTARVVMQAGDPERVVTVGDLQMDQAESAIGLYHGERLPRAVLLRAMLIVSANDAAKALAVDVGGTTDAFVGMMNDAAAELGLTGTRASNPTGLDDGGGHSTAHDLAVLASVLMQDETFRATVARTSASLHGQTFPSTNAAFLTGYPGGDGVKTGHTTGAGYCLVASATRDGRRIVAVVLGASSDAGRIAGATALLDWAFAST